jgi:hypothetical protein
LPELHGVSILKHSFDGGVVCAGDVEVVVPLIVVVVVVDVANGGVVEVEVVVGRGVVVTVRLTHGPGMHWYCAGFGKPGTFILVVKHCPCPVGFTVSRPNT